MGDQDGGSCLAPYWLVQKRTFKRGQLKLVRLGPIGSQYRRQLLACCWRVAIPYIGDAELDYFAIGRPGMRSLPCES